MGKMQKMYIPCEGQCPTCLADVKGKYGEFTIFLKAVALWILDDQVRSPSNDSKLQDEKTCR